MQFCSFLKKFALQFINVRESSSVHFLLQNTPNTIQLDLGRVSSVATNQACVEQIIVIGMIEIEIEHGFTSAPTQYRLYGRRFYRSDDPNNSVKALKEGG